MKHIIKQKGLTLIELMVSLVLGLLITAIVIAMFAQTKRNYNQDEEIAHMQENGRFAIQMLANEVAHAGFLGNMHFSTGEIDLPAALKTSYAVPFTSDCTSSWFKPTTRPIEVFNQSVAPTTCFSDARTGTNILIVKRVANTPETSLSGKFLFTSYGKHGSFFVGSTSVSGYQYWNYMVNMYYIKDDDNGIPGLARKRLTFDGTALDVSTDGIIVPGIQDFTVLLGHDSDATANFYGVPTRYVTNVTTATVYSGETVSDKIVSARINILARSLNENPSTVNNRKYSLYTDDTPTGYGLTGTGFYGRVFSTAVMIRNLAQRIQLEKLKNPPSS